MSKLRSGQVVRDRREACGLTRNQLAYQAETSISTIARLELENKYPNAAVLARVAAVLGASVDEILGIPVLHKDAKALAADQKAGA